MENRPLKQCKNGSAATRLCSKPKRKNYLAIFSRYMDSSLSCCCLTVINELYFFTRVYDVKFRAMIAIIYCVTVLIGLPSTTKHAAVETWYRQDYGILRHRLNR